MKENGIKSRSESHREGAICRNNYLTSVNMYCKGLRVYFRAGDKTTEWLPGSPHNRETRTMSDSRPFAKKLGLDIIITNEMNEIWCQIDVRKPKVVQKMKRYKYFRTKAPENGIPEEEVVESFFKNQYVIAIYSHSDSPRHPHTMKIAPFAPLVRLGYGRGYYFPKHKGRINTVHWYTAKTEWREAFIPGYEERSGLVSLRPDGICQPDLLGGKISMCQLLQEILKNA